MIFCVCGLYPRGLCLGAISLSCLSYIFGLYLCYWLWNLYFILKNDPFQAWECVVKIVSSLSYATSAQCVAFFIFVTSLVVMPWMVAESL